MIIPLRHALQLAGLWLFLVVVSLFSRSYFPIDETRCVTVAWNMWLRGDFLVPYLNDVAYSHKPPLLYWLINLGWAVFGVNDWWPRLVPSFFALGSTYLSIRMAERLWPMDKIAAQIAPMILLGSFWWMAFTTVTLFDMLVAFFTLLGMLGVLIAWEDKPLKGWLMFGIAIGGGLLAKGPTIMLQLLPLALLAPWWGRDRQQHWRRWYLGILCGLLLGAGIALAWAIPAAIRGGPAYEHAIFWGQTADRMVQSFAHRRPLWWYVPLLPLMLFPWLFWLPIWRAAGRLRGLMTETGVRFCLAWLIPVFIAFSLISGKQIQYLLPIFPAFALLAARGLTQDNQMKRFDAWPALFTTLLAGCLMLYLPFYAQSHHSITPWVRNIPLWGGAILIAGPLFLLLPRRRSLLAATWSLMLLSAIAITSIEVAIVKVTGDAYDVTRIARKIATLQQAGVPLAHGGGAYPGQYNFVGRLKTSPEVVDYYLLNRWFDTNPQGRAIVYFGKSRGLGNLKPEFIQDYMGIQVAIVTREQWRAWSEVHEINKDEPMQEEN